MTVSRLASVIGGLIIPSLIRTDDHLINSTMVFGFGLCVVSLGAGIMLVIVDAYADRKDKKELTISADEKF